MVQTLAGRKALGQVTIATIPLEVSTNGPYRSSEEELVSEKPQQITTGVKHVMKQRESRFKSPHAVRAMARQVSPTTHIEAQSPHS